MRKNIKSLYSIQSILLILISLFCINMSTGVEKDKELKPEFVELKEDEPSFNATVYDNSHKIDVTNFSFTGHASIGGIRKEDDDSINKIDLSEIKELKVIDPDYTSKKYSDKDLILAQITLNDGTEIKNLLFPRQIIICGKAKIKKAWLLRKINRVVIKKEDQIVLGKKKIVNEKKEKGLWEKLKGAVKTVSEKLSP